MPKTRNRVNQAGAKSTSHRVKCKIGGRKSVKGALQLSTKELGEMLEVVAKRDRNMLRRILESRDLLPSQALEA
jgi:hypothetical protein